MPGDCFLQDLIQIAGGVLRLPARPADTFTEARSGHEHEGKEREAEEGEAPVGSEDYDQQAEGGKDLPQKIGKHVGTGDLNFVDVVHDRRHQTSGGSGFEKCRAVAEHLIEDLIAEVGDGREADEVREVIAKIVADTAQRKDHHGGDGEDGEDVVNRVREEVFEIDLIVDDRNFEERFGGVASNPGWRTRPTTTLTSSTLIAVMAPKTAINKTETISRNQ